LRSDSLFLPTSLSQPISLYSFLPLSPIHSIFFYFPIFSFLLNRPSFLLPSHLANS
jgi:hypothetical protein